MLVVAQSGCSCKEREQDILSGQGLKLRHSVLCYEALGAQLWYGFCYLMVAHGQCHWPGALPLDGLCRSALELLLAACFPLHCHLLLLHTSAVSPAVQVPITEAATATATMQATARAISDSDNIRHDCGSNSGMT